MAEQDPEYPGAIAVLYIDSGILENAAKNRIMDDLRARQPLPGFMVDCDADRILRRREAAQGVGALLAAERRLAAAKTSSGTCACRAAFRTVAARVSGLIRRLRPKGGA